MEDINLLAMVTLRDTFGVKVGYSDHSEGFHIPIAAVALGATVIEKHFTLDKKMPGPDHRASLEPKELAMMVTRIHQTEFALGDGIKKPSKGELKNRDIVRKSIVASKPIPKGTCLSASDITVKRPGTGISPADWSKVIGSITKRDYHREELIEWD
jgi:sialic acid synthase SpsE